MTYFFPNINLNALSKFAAETAAIEHPQHDGGSQPLPVTPRVVQMQDIHWAGEKMILISFEPSTVPLGPRSMLAYFPTGRHRLTTQALVGMTAAVRRRRTDLAPKIYAYKDYITGDCLRAHPVSGAVLETGQNDIGAEVVLLEKIPGDCLETLWPKMSAKQQKLVCIRLADILLNLYNARGSHIGTDLRGKYVDTRCDRLDDLDVPPGQRPPHIPGSVLLTRALNDGPLAEMPLPSAVTTIEGYLEALAARVERVFDSDPVTNIKGRHSGWFMESPMSDQDVARAQATWGRLKKLIPYNTGGFYHKLSEEHRLQAQAVLRCPQFGVYHSDMKMSRFVVKYVPPTSSSPQDVVLTIATGWEHAYRAPAWSCARLPIWLESPLLPLNMTITPKRRRELRNFIHDHLNTPEMRALAHDWLCSWIFGFPERWFEGVLCTHWAMPATVEVCIRRLKAYWEEARKDIPFPLVVQSGAVRRQEPPDDYARDQSLIMDSLNALARASGTNPEDWCLAMQSGQFPNGN